MESVTRFITQKLKLKVNETKSAVARPAERKFLGFSFTDGSEVKRVIASKALERFKKRIREITCRAKSVSLEATMAELVPYLRGWRGYFGFCETPEVLIWFNPLGSSATPCCSLATMENSTSSQGGTIGTRGATANGE